MFSDFAGAQRLAPIFPVTSCSLFAEEHSTSVMAMDDCWLFAMQVYFYTLCLFALSSTILSRSVSFRTYFLPDIFLAIFQNNFCRRSPSVVIRHKFNDHLYLVNHLRTSYLISNTTWQIIFRDSDLISRHGHTRIYLWTTMTKTSRSLRVMLFMPMSRNII